jgi:hypothetical protein
MGAGFDHEVADVARRIQAEAERRGANPSIVTPFNVRQAVRLLSKYATRLHRCYENACNAEQSPAELRRETDTEARAMALCHRLGVTLRLNGDPRGAPIRIPCAPESANGWGQDAIVVPYGSQREYDKRYEKDQRERAQAEREAKEAEMAS